MAGQTAVVTGASGGIGRAIAVELARQGADVVVRGVIEQFRTQMEMDRLVDAGARYMRRHPQSARTKDIAAQLGDLSRKAGDNERAGIYMQASGADTPQKAAKRREEQARRFVISRAPVRQASSIASARRRSPRDRIASR